LWCPVDNFSATVAGQVYHANQNGAEQKSIRDTNPVLASFRRTIPVDFDWMRTLLCEPEWGLPWGTAKSTPACKYLRHSQQVDGSRSDLATVGFYDDIAVWSTWVRNITEEVSLSSSPGGKLTGSPVFFT